jgi:hypothetical protein
VGPTPSEVGSQQIGPYGHGTHVAGLLALIAPDAKIIPVRVLDPQGIGNIWVLAEAITYAVDQGADVINMSLATPRRTHLLGSVLNKVCDDVPLPGEEDFPAATNPYLVIVAGAGNTGDSTKMYPAAENIGGLLAVGASTQQDTLASFSTRASWIQVVAPGEGIPSSVPNGFYGTWSGTSMAAPIAAGEVALVRAAFPNLTNKKIIQHITRNETSVDIGGPVKKRIDAGLALTTQPEVDPSPSPTPIPTPSPSPTPSATPTPTPSPSPSPANPIDASPFFVEQHYRDFLERLPDQSGFAYWTERIEGNNTNNPAPCASGDNVCLLQRRIGVSAAFFIETEFQDTGGFVYRFYRSSLGRRPSFAEFSTDRSQVVGGASLETKKQAFASNWVQRTDFLQKYPANLEGPQFIDALLQNVMQTTGVDLSERRAALIADWNANQNRASVLRLIADDSQFAQAEYNNAFVLMQYFGYLRRKPDQNGYDFWLNILNQQAPNNYRSMVCSFTTSMEYQRSFGTMITHNNTECQQ